VVLGVNLEGQKEVLGLWTAQTEGAKFWLQVLTELQKNPHSAHRPPSKRAMA
jgi:transposase-like protein